MSILPAQPRATELSLLDRDLVATRRLRLPRPAQGGILKEPRPSRRDTLPMLLVGRHTQRTCSTLHRRAFLQVGASSVLGLPLADLLKARAAGGGAPARNVILLWLWGGPSQLDTFDPKPNAPLDYRGPFG